MNTHHIVIKNLDEFIELRKQNRDMVLGFDFKNKIICEIVDKDIPMHIIQIGYFPAWRTPQDILDIMFKNILDNHEIKIMDNGISFKNYFMEWN